MPLGFVYLGMLIVGGAVANFVAEAHWLTTLALYIPQMVYALPAVPLAFWAFRQRNRRAAILCGASLLMVGGPLMGFRVPYGPGAEAEGTKIRVLTWNIHSATAGLEKIEAEIERWQPDVVLLTEARADDPGLQRDLAALFPDWESRATKDLYVTSRFPMSPIRTISLPGLTARALAQVELRIEGQSVTFVGAHFATAFQGRNLRYKLRALPDYMQETASARLAQAEATLAQVGKSANPVILAGDFNTPPRGKVYRLLRRALTDSFAATGWGWGHTYSSKRPSLRIDYVFVRDMQPVGCWVGGRQGSDHRPLIADLVLAPTSPGSPSAMPP